MKKLIITLSILMFASSLKSQIVENWTTPAALTDSSSFNSNPVVCNFWETGSDDLFMFYEKRQSPSGLSQIWWKKISDPMSEEQMLIGGWPEVDYINPQIWQNEYLIFECNVYGNYDIFGVKFDAYGLVGNPFQLTNTTYDENSFFCTNYYSNGCCWESEGKIIATELQISQDTLKLASLEIVDSINCFDPVLQQNDIAWRKVENNESHIYYSRKTYPNWNWSSPDTLAPNNNTNLSPSTTMQFFGGGYSLCWQADDKIYYSSTWGSPPTVSSPDIPRVEKYYEPAGFNLVLGVDNLSELYSFAGETAFSRDIYIVDEWFSGYVLNITEDSLVNKNPRLFPGRQNLDYYEIINIWQTEINGHDVLFTSNAWYLATGGVDEDELSELYISPNPLGDGQKITIHSPEDISINTVQVCNVAGHLIFEKKFNSQANQFDLDLNNAKAGVYFVKIQTSRGEAVRKVIKL